VVIHTRDADFTLIQADVLDGLASLEDRSVHTVVTSPPYWGLRDYGTGDWEGGDPACDHKQGRDGSGRADGIVDDRAQRNRDGAAALTRSVCACGAVRQDQQLGLEATPDLYVARMVEVFREVRRVLRDDGTCWLNLGDSYNADHKQRERPNMGLNAGNARTHEARLAPGLKPKDLVGIPWRVAFALQADGWYLRSDIIWAKPNPMPESITDRPTKSHEYVFLLTKKPRYFFDQEAVREPAEWNRWGDQTVGPGSNPNGWIKPKSREELNARRSSYKPGQTTGNTLEGHERKSDEGLTVNPAGRNVRSVWEIATQPYAEAHFATYPEELVRRCILAGTSEQGCCPVCGAPWEREVERQFYGSKAGDGDPMVEGFQRNRMGGQKFYENEYVPPKTLGWRPGCDCLVEVPDVRLHVPEPIPCTVLDPFLGSGTTAHVARKHGRRSIGIELKASYCDLAARRLQQQSLFA
jgi:DNA modification methylase